MKEYPGVKALQGVDLDVREAEVHCLLGPNGAGKSTLIKCVSGAVEPTSGEILFLGEPLPAGDPAGSLKRGVATIYQELDLVEDLSVAESIFLAHEPRRRGLLLDLDKMYHDSAALLKRLGHESIPPRAKVGALRPAAQQIVSIARALSGNVRLLIMDEPSAILDEGEIETLFDVVRRLTAEGARSSSSTPRGRSARIGCCSRCAERGGCPRSATSASRSTPARSSGSAGSSAPAAASCCGSSTGSTSPTTVSSSSTASR